MSDSETRVEGTILPDGTLVLDERPNLPAGRVTILLPRETELAASKADAFWMRMQAIWDAQKAAGQVPRSTEEIEAQQRKLREGWGKRQQAIEQLQDEARGTQAAADQQHIRPSFLQAPKRARPRTRFDGRKRLSSLQFM